MDDARRVRRVRVGLHNHDPDLASAPSTNSLSAAAQPLAMATRPQRTVSSDFVQAGDLYPSAIPAFGQLLTAPPQPDIHLGIMRSDFDFAPRPAPFDTLRAVPHEGRAQVHTDACGRLTANTEISCKVRKQTPAQLVGFISLSARPSRRRECLLENDDLARMVQVVLRRPQN